MAGIADIAGVDMRTALARGNYGVVAGRTAAVDMTMIDCRRRDLGPAGREHGMTGLAGVAGVDMGGGLAAGSDTVMTGNAVGCEGGMIHHRDRHPGQR